MKFTHLIFAIALILSPGSTFAFKLGDLAKGADAISGAAESSKLLAKGNDLLKAFKGNEKAMSAAKGLLNSFKAEDYLKGFSYYDKITGAGLTSAQLATWNDIKNTLSAYVLERNFDFEEKDLSEMVAEASAALQNGGFGKATRYLTQLRKAATLTKGQKDLIKTIIAHSPPAE